MAFVSRAERDFNKSNPSQIGPGSYTSLSTYAQNQTFAPFCSTSERKLFSFPITQTPGPGSYNPQPRSQSKSPSKGCFFSQPQKKSQIINSESPGPGSYSVVDTWKSKKSITKQGSSSIWNRIPSAPSIPANHQAYGYEETLDGDLIMQNHPDKIYSGTINDSVGPGHYKIQEKKVKNGVAWFKSKTRRMINFKDNTGPELGPGSYQDTIFTVAPLYKFKPSAVFLSRYKDPEPVSTDVGPGYYNPPSPTKVQKYPKRLQNFGSNSKRFDNKIREPELGPGYYFIEEQKDISNSKAPFASSNSRFNYKNSLTPGPGTYENSLDRSLSIKKGKNAAMNKEKRFLNTKKTETPGPGQYSEIKRLGYKNKKPSAAFVSKSTRWLSVPAKIPAPGSYEIKSTIGTVQKKGNSIHPLLNKKSKSESNIGFYSKAARFNDKSTKNIEIPGPGAYNTLQNPSKNAPTLGKDTRFKPDQNEGPGPGTYLEDSEWNKKSFNILFTDLF